MNTRILLSRPLQCFDHRGTPPYQDFYVSARDQNSILMIVSTKDFNGKPSPQFPDFAFHVTESNKCYPSLDGGIKHHLLSMGVLPWITSWKKMDSSSPSYHQQQVTLQTRVEGWQLMSFFFRLHAGALTNLIFSRSSSEAICD